MIKNMNHMSFTVSNLDQSIKFYRDILGLEMISLAERDREFSEKATGIKGAHLKIAYFAAGNCAVELIQYLSPKGKKLDTTTCNVGSAHVCFNVEDMRGMMGRLKKEGVKFISEPNKVPAGPNKGRLMVYLKDPDENTIEFFSMEREDD